MADRNPMRKLIARIIRWANVEASGDDGGPYQVQQLSYLERTGKSAAIYPFGFSALAPKDTLAFFATISAQSENRVHMPISGPDRVRLKPGEVVVYHPKTGSKIHFKADGSIEVEAGTSEVKIDAANLTLTGATKIDGSLNVTGAVDMDGTLEVNGVATFDDAIMSSSSEDPAYDLAGHVHLSNFSTGPGDVDPPKDP